MLVTNPDTRRRRTRFAFHEIIFLQIQSALALVEDRIPIPRFAPIDPSTTLAMCVSTKCRATLLLLSKHALKLITLTTLLRAHKILQKKILQYNRKILRAHKRVIVPSLCFFCFMPLLFFSQLSVPSAGQPGPSSRHTSAFTRWFSHRSSDPDSLGPHGVKRSGDELKFGIRLGAVTALYCNPCGCVTPLLNHPLTALTKNPFDSPRANVKPDCTTPRSERPCVEVYTTAHREQTIDLGVTDILRCYTIHPQFLTSANVHTFFTFALLRPVG